MDLSWMQIGLAILIALSAVGAFFLVKKVKWINDLFWKVTSFVAFWTWVGLILGVSAAFFSFGYFSKDFVQGWIPNPQLFRWGMLAFVVVAVILSLHKVPTVHYGVVLRFDRPTGRVLEHGLHILVPFIDTLSLYSAQTITMSINESSISKDGVEVWAKGKLQLSIDMKLLVSTFIHRSFSTICDGLRGSVKSTLGNIAGTKMATAFIQKREAISLLINSQLRMDDPFHVEAEKKIDEENDEIDRHNERVKRLPKTQRIGDSAPKKRKSFNAVDHCDKCKFRIRNHLENEVAMAHSQSLIEKRYGIKILEFALEDIDYSAETKKNFELAKQTEAKMKADQIEANKRLKLVDSYIAKGLSPEKALYAAEVGMEDAERNLITLDGLKDFNLFGDLGPKILTAIGSK